MLREHRRSEPPNSGLEPAARHADADPRRGSGLVVTPCHISMHLRILAVALCCFSITGELAAVARHVQPVPEEERIWQTFVDWFRSRPPSGNPRELVEPYREHLVQTGLSKADVNQQMSVVWSGVFRRRTLEWVRDATRYSWR